MKIAIYGGSFNPPHLGHYEAAKTVSEYLSPDILLIIPDNVPPHKEMAPNSPTGEQRLELCRLNFAGLPNLEISDMELSREGRSYSADTIANLRQEYPDDEFFLVIGSDMFMSFEDWWNFKYLMENCTLTVASRMEDDLYELQEHQKHLEQAYGAKVLILPHEPVIASSTDIRDLLRRRMGCEYLNGDVYAEIIRNNYYEALPELPWLRNQVLPYLTSKRVAHVAGCEGEAVRLAMFYGEDPEDAAVAGILHDITKKMTYDEQLILCRKYDIICDNELLSNGKLLHAITGAALSKDLFGIDERIYQAIRWHTTGKPDMTLLEKIVYLADGIEPTRDYEGVDKLRDLAYKNIDKAMEYSLEMNLDDLTARNIVPHEDSVNAYLWYKNKNSDN